MPLSEATPTVCDFDPVCSCLLKSSTGAMLLILPHHQFFTLLGRSHNTTGCLKQNFLLTARYPSLHCTPLQQQFLLKLSVSTISNSSSPVLLNPLLSSFHSIHFSLVQATMTFMLLNAMVHSHSSSSLRYHQQVAKWVASCFLVRSFTWFPVCHTLWFSIYLAGHSFSFWLTSSSPHPPNLLILERLMAQSLIFFSFLLSILTPLIILYSLHGFKYHLYVGVFQI